ncbi:Nis1p [Lachancea thermotolerans CBS 6340]|uniref:KLTH0G08800p n=1 Tax=Lachancea thermotolerans (strain ATCC 56472 / CBS 6340 / NRRL Y-8284) TaxID=559295 RepID=C5DMG8_LACTC|nr:KLTH0G08800p [Lachancea thermotolerans CBS 6340]CAR24979.1 KLTH0G08800p [Lachancea thermotolerans CBS 6340]
MCSEYSLLSQESIVVDLSIQNPRLSNALHCYPTSTSPSSPDSDRLPFYQRTNAARALEDAEDMTDEEQEQSLIQPLIDAHNRSSDEPLRLKTTCATTALPQRVPVPYRTHRPQHSQTVTILDESESEQSKPFVSQQLTMSQFDLQQTRNFEQRAKLRQQALEAHNSDSNNTLGILDKVCKWSRYSKRAQKRPQRTPSARSASSVRRAPSLSKRKDFSNKSEMASFASSGNFIFHRGFSLRRAPGLPPRYKYRSRAELASAMDYVAPESTPVTDFTTSQHFLTMQLKPPAFWQVLRLHPKFTYKFVSAGSLYRQSLNSQKGLHRNSIRRPSPLPQRVRTLRRSKSVPGSRKNITLQLQNPQLYDVWRHYVMSVVLQRIQFRMYLVNSSNSDKVSTSESDASQPLSRCSSLALQASWINDFGARNTRGDDTYAGSCKDEASSISSSGRHQGIRRLRLVS